jgi:hypothetical protein
MTDIITQKTKTLEFACKHKYSNMIKIILKECPSKIDYSKSSAILYACKYGSIEIVDQLISDGASLYQDITTDETYDIIKKSRSGPITGLFVAVICKHYSLVESTIRDLQRPVHNKFHPLFKLCMDEASKQGKLDYVAKFLNLMTALPITLPAEEKTEEKIIDSNDLCIVCANRKVATIIVPCGHSKLCVTCSRELVLTHKNTKCPCCRQKITQIIKIFK